MLSPLQQTSELATSGLGKIWSGLFGATAVETAQLRAENLRLKARLVDFSETRQENERLRGLLAFGAELEPRTVAARVIAVDATSWFSTVTVDRGDRDGVREGQAVMTTMGAVGRVVATAPHSARVLLIVDASSRISTLVERTRTRGVCRGNGETLILDYVPLTDDVKEGDILVTSGLGGGFPKGLVVGTVKTVAQRGFDMFQTIRIEPAVDFSRLEEVLVVVPAERAGEPQNAPAEMPGKS